VGKHAIALGDRLLSVADGSLDKAMNSGFFKSTSHMVKRAYVTQIRAPALRVKERYSKLVRQASHAKRALVDEYQKALVHSDRLVDFYLPGKLGKETVKLPVLLIKKKGMGGLISKIGARSKLHAAEAAKKASCALKNAPTTFKMTFVAARRKVLTLPLTLKTKMTTVASSALKRASAYLAVADKFALRFSATTRVRDLAVRLFHEDKLAAPLPVDHEVADEQAETPRYILKITVPSLSAPFCGGQSRWLDHGTGLPA